MIGHDDMLIACMDLAGRAGASDFEIGHTGDDDGPADAPIWYAHVQYRGARVIVDGQTSPVAAAYGLAVRLLSGAMCRCRRRVTLGDGDGDGDGCRWRLVGQRWEPGCDAPPLRVDGPRGDLGAMRRALAEPPPPANRRDRRKSKRGKKRRR